MIAAEGFLTAAAERGFRLWTGVPCSYLTPFINAAIDSEGLDWVGAANEGDAVAIAAGAELAGRRAVALFQNSGLGNAVNPLTSLAYTFELPMLLVPTLRGEPGGAPDEPQHELMGRITTDLLDLMQIPWEFFPGEEPAIAAALDRAVAHMQSARRPYALVMRKGDVGPRKLAARAQPNHPSAPAPERAFPESVAARAEMLRAVQAAAGPRDAVLATTGFTGRELCALDDRANQLYMVGSMGCVVSLALGVARARRPSPSGRVIALDGDGALLMRMGAMATVGHERPQNLVHVLLDNGVHESTGAQATVSRSIDFGAVAAGCGYERVLRVTEPAELERALADRRPGLAFIHALIRPGVIPDLPRPALAPAAVARRFRAFLSEDE